MLLLSCKGGKIMSEDNRTEIEILKRDMELLVNLAGKFDTAIDRLTTVSNSIDKMLGIHENRLMNQEKQAEVIHNRITDFKKELIDEIKQLRKENEEQHKIVSERLERLEKWRWFVVGIAAAIGFILAQVKSFSGLFS
jgi:ElaB/YqjD/DUF883 family membrane-anchored ribosome-binding protein